MNNSKRDSLNSIKHIYLTFSIKCDHKAVEVELEAAEAIATAAVVAVGAVAAAGAAAPGAAGGAGGGSGGAQPPPGLPAVGTGQSVLGIHYGLYIKK